MIRIWETHSLLPNAVSKSLYKILFKRIGRKKRKNYGLQVEAGEMTPSRTCRDGWEGDSVLPDKGLGLSSTAVTMPNAELQKSW